MKVVVTKRDLDGQVAALLGKKVREVSGVTEVFLHEITRALVESGVVRLDGLGVLHLDCRAGSRAVLTGLHGKKKPSRTQVIDVEKKYYVSFKKAAPLRAAIQARYGKAPKGVLMEKYAVDEKVDPNLEKKAAAGCPECGAECTRHGNTLLCPTHGSAPFEKKTP